jgi:hypothetical protein
MAYINLTQAQVDSIIQTINARAKLSGTNFTGPVSGTTFTGSFIGNADTATKLATAHTINGVAFDGTADITVADTTKAPIVSPVFTGQVFIPEGTATTPGLTFPNDGSQDTGLYHISDGSFGVTNNGTETVAFTPVGVNLLGTPTAPTAAVGTSTDQIATTKFVAVNSPLKYIPSTQSYSIQVPDNTTTGGNARGTGAVDLQTSRNAANQVASGRYSFGAGSYNTVSGDYSVALGANNTVSDISCFVSGFGNTASGYCSVALGNENTASNTYCFTVGSQNKASASYSIAMGAYNVASGNNSVAIGAKNVSPASYSVSLGYYNNASGNYSTALGNKSSTNGISSKTVFGSGFSTTVGTYQTGTLGLGAVTTDATATILKSDTNAVSSSNICVLQNNNAVSFDIEVVAFNAATGTAGQWNTTGLIKRGANASSTALVGLPTINLTFGDSEGWIKASVVSISADTTNGGLTVSVTGAASTTIQWMCRINTVEVTYG